MQREWATIPLFEGLGPVAREKMHGVLRSRHFAPGEVICREGDMARTLFIIESGSARVSVGRPQGSWTVARLHKGDVVGEMSLITGEPRSATVEAILPTTTLELDQQTFGSILPQHPELLANLTRILSRRLARADAQLGWGQQHGEAVALVTGESMTGFAGQIVASAQAASPRSVLCLDLTGALPASVRHQKTDTEGVLEILDHSLSTHGAVLIVLGAQDSVGLLQHMDRVVLLGDEEECSRAARECGRPAEIVLVIREAGRAPSKVAGLKVVRTINAKAPDKDIAWLGRHLSRTKIGLALGAGGAKGYAHVGALKVLEESAYPVDYVSGSSIGAMVGAWLALGKNVEAIETNMKHAFTPENVASIFRLSFGGMSSGTNELQRICFETTQDLNFSDTMIPLTIMAVDLERKRSVPMADGSIWQALMAATAVPGLHPPFAIDSQRLVDAIALTPVPTEAVRNAGADIVVAINLISRDMLPAWPTEVPLPATAATSGSRMLDTLLEVMDLMQLDCGIRQASLADVVVTPCFGPSTWRDFQLADLFVCAGQKAMEKEMPTLRSRVNPQPRQGMHSGGIHGDASIHI